MSALPKVVAWFEIPSVDFDRAVRFYEAALDAPLNRRPADRRVQLRGTRDRRRDRP
jgi:predicted enzyme related to lactoylglutathione lyase